MLFTLQLNEVQMIDFEITHPGLKKILGTRYII